MIDSEEATLRIVDLTQKHFPQAKLLVRARDRSHAYRLVKKGVQHIYHEMQGSALKLSIGTLKELGYPAERAEDIGRIFERHEFKAIRELANFEGQEGFFRRVREQIKILEQAVSALPVIPPKGPTVPFQ